MTLGVAIPVPDPVAVQIISGGPRGPKGDDRVFIGPDEPVLTVGFGPVVWFETNDDYTDIVEVHIGFA